MSKTKTKKSVIKPLISVAGETHELEKLFEGDQNTLPEIKSVGYMRLGEKANNWVSYVITTKGDKVLSIEVDEPNMQLIAQESAQISFVNLFIDKD